MLVIITKIKITYKTLNSYLISLILIPLNCANGMMDVIVYGQPGLVFKQAINPPEELGSSASSVSHQMTNRPHSCPLSTQLSVKRKHVVWYLVSGKVKTHAG